MKVVVVDDHPLVWEGLKAVLAAEKDIQLCGWAHNGKAAEELVEELQPDIVMVDLRLPGENGVDIIKNLKPKTKCRYVVLTSFSDASDIKRAIQAGVEGYLLKDALPEELISALRLVGRGRQYFDPTVMHLLVYQSQNDQDSLSELTSREIDVLCALARGMSNKEIAFSISVSENTVKKHISSILSKLELKDRTQAALFAVSHGIGSLPEPLIGLDG